MALHLQTNPIIWLRFLIQDIHVHIFEQNYVTCMTLIDLSYVQENSIKLYNYEVLNNYQ